MFIKNMSKRERYIALAAFSFVFIAILYNFVIDPVFRARYTLNTDIQAKTAALKRDLAMVASRGTLEANYSKFSKYVKSEKSEEEAVAETLTYLEDLSRADSCRIINIKPISTKSFDSYKEVSIDLSSEGTLSQFSKFLYDVENAKNMILKVRNFVLTAKAGQEGVLKGTFLITKIIIE